MPYVATPQRCATMPVHRRLLDSAPGYAGRCAELENFTFRRPEAARQEVARIPVVVHVVRESPDDVGDEQVAGQIEVLNRDFRGETPDIALIPEVWRGLVGDARVEFFLAEEDPDGEPTSGIIRVPTSVPAFGTDDSVKAGATGGSDAWPAEHYLNIWVCQLAGGVLGYAQFPSGPPTTDGVVITHTAFGTTGTAITPFDGGRTTTHEVGHWLNLRHIWGDDGEGCHGSDFVDDTPNQGGPNQGRPTYPTVSCANGPHGDMFMNFMDYTDDACMAMFTAGQVERMNAALSGPRAALLTAPAGSPSAGTAATGTASTAGQASAGH
nr:zinc metalloprotease [Phytoactinopolyspora alkaliphila]